MEIKFIKTNPDAVIPTTKYADDRTRADSGLDLTSVCDVVIPSRQSAVVDVGLKVGYITPGYWFRIEGRSGLGFKHSVSPHQGIIDNLYRGTLGVKLYNNSDVDYHVKKGERIAQMVVYNLIVPETSETDIADETKRGESGFGSTGK